MSKNKSKYGEDVAQSISWWIVWFQHGTLSNNIVAQNSFKSTMDRRAVIPLNSTFWF